MRCLQPSKTAGARRLRRVQLLVTFVFLVPLFYLHNRYGFTMAYPDRPDVSHEELSKAEHMPKSQLNNTTAPALSTIISDSQSPTRATVADAASKFEKVHVVDSAEEPQSARTPRCRNIILLSAPRHGSTWMVDSATSCIYSRGQTRSFRKDVFGKTEIWSGHEGPLLNISADDAIEYVKEKTSVKMFRSTFNREKNKAKRLLKLAVKEGVPLVVLTRRLEASYQSMTSARRTKNWIVLNYTEGKERAVELEEDEAELESYRRELQNYFEFVNQTLQDVGATEADWFDYDDVKDEHTFYARNSGCYIWNCNYLSE